MPRPTTTPNPSAGPVIVTNSTIVAQLTDEIRRTLRSFHEHSKDCRLCRNPVAAYQDGASLCPIGNDLSIAITELLYKKAEHVPNGAFEVEYKHGWSAVDGLIRIICHFNQGEYTNKIVDLKRQPLHAGAQQRYSDEDHHRHYHYHHHSSQRREPRYHSSDRRYHRNGPSSSAPHLLEDNPGLTMRGSQYEEDLRRRHRMRSPTRTTTSSTRAVYGDPRVSYLDAPTLRPQSDEISPASSSRSVHFDTHVQVLEYHP